MTGDKIPPAREKPKRQSRKAEIGIDYRGATSVELEIHRCILMHTLASEHFKCRQFWIFEFLVGFLTMVSSIMAFVTTSEYVSHNDQLILADCVGATTVVVGFMQALNSNLGYATRAAMHEAVAIDLRDLRSHLRILKCKEGGFTDQKGIQDLSEKEEEEFIEKDVEGIIAGTSFESIQDKFEQTLNGCKSAIPVQILEAFSGIESTITTTWVHSNMELFTRLYGPNFPFDLLRFKPYDLVSEKISDYKYFPVLLPKASSIIRNTKELLKQEYKEGWDFYSTDDSGGPDPESRSTAVSADHFWR